MTDVNCTDSATVTVDFLQSLVYLIVREKVTSRRHMLDHLGTSLSSQSLGYGTERANLQQPR